MWLKKAFDHLGSVLMAAGGMGGGMSKLMPKMDCKTV
jgi:hypothetical protein